MGIFDSIKKAIFGEAKAETVAPAPSSAAPGAPAPALAQIHPAQEGDVAGHLALPLG